MRKWRFIFAQALRIQADEVVLIVSNTQAKHVDPIAKAHLLPPGRLPGTGTLGIDATIPASDIDRRVYEGARIFRLNEVEVPG